MRRDDFKFSHSMRNSSVEVPSVVGSCSLDDFRLDERHIVYHDATHRILELGAFLYRLRTC